MFRRRSIWDEMERMQREMDMLFRNMPNDDVPLLESGEGKDVPAYRRPRCELSETDKDIVANIEMPGVDKKDIKLNVTDDGIEVKSEKEDVKEKGDKEKGDYSYMKSYSGFYRSFPLPKGVDPDNAEAEFKNGVLTVKVPKKQIEEKKKKYLEVK